MQGKVKPSAMDEQSVVNCLAGGSGAGGGEGFRQMARVQESCTGLGTGVGETKRNGGRLFRRGEGLAAVGERVQAVRAKAWAAGGKGCRRTTCGRELRHYLRGAFG